jgi:hypothetical protein
MKLPDRCVLGTLLPLLAGCTDTATFVTSTSVGINANVQTEQAHIGYARAELFQGPDYPDVGDTPQVVGYLGSDLAIFTPHIRQLYATGDAAGLITAPNDPLACPATGETQVNGQPTMCAERAETLAGERRPLVFGTGTLVGLQLGFTGNAPSSIKFGYDREELSVIPLHRLAPKVADPSKATDPSDKYSSVLGSINLALGTPNLAGTDLKLEQFFATGAAARNLAKRPEIRQMFRTTATGVIGQFAPDKSSDCIIAWVGNDQAKVQKVSDAAHALNITAGPFFDLPQYAPNRAKFVADNSVPCS